MENVSNNTNFIMLITYNFTSDYVSIPCKTEEEAVLWLHKFLDEEIATIKEEQGYDPVVKTLCDSGAFTEIKLLYIDDEAYFDACTDVATYRVIEIKHGA